MKVCCTVDGAAKTDFKVKLLKKVFYKKIKIYLHKNEKYKKKKNLF